MYNKGYDSDRGTPLSPAFKEEAAQGTGECIAVLGTMTNALQAQKTLANAAIFASITKISSSKSAKGCTYGVSYPCIQDKNVRTILARSDLAVKKYMGG